LRRLHDVAVDDLLVDGHYIRVGGLLGYDTDRHCAIFSVTALDPQPTADWLAERRDQVRTAAASARLAERQRDLLVPAAPASIGLVAAAGDPALERAEERLTACGFAIEVKVYAPTVAGAAAGDQLANGLREAALGGHDIVLLLRQDGRPLSLAPYDAEAVVRAVATSTTPVLTGLGSPDEPAAAEEVSHQAYPTADEATLSVVRRLQRAYSLVDDTVATVADAADDALRRAARKVEQTRHGLVEGFRQAHVRAERVRKARVRWIRVAALVLALAVVGGAVATMVWPLLAALVIPLGIALAAPRLRTKRRGPVLVTEYTFSEALEELSGIARKLQEVSDPDDVFRLEAEAGALADHCRSLLRRPRSLRQSGPDSSETAARQLPSVTADGGIVASKAGPLAAAASADDTDLTRGDEPIDTVVLPADPVSSEQR
jgi:exodeoxyribonuclease VII large subunit